MKTSWTARGALSVMGKLVQGQENCFAYVGVLVYTKICVFLFMTKDLWKGNGV